MLDVKELYAACNECLQLHPLVSHLGVSNSMTLRKQDFTNQLFCLEWCEGELKGLVPCSLVQSSVRCFLSNLVGFSSRLALV